MTFTVSLTAPIPAPIGGSRDPLVIPLSWPAGSCEIRISPGDTHGPALIPLHSEVVTIESSNVTEIQIDHALVRKTERRSSIKAHCRFL
jgi:hypothetical protein